MKKNPRSVSALVICMSSLLIPLATSVANYNTTWHGHGDSTSLVIRLDRILVKPVIDSTAVNLRGFETNNGSLINEIDSFLAKDLYYVFEVDSVTDLKLFIEELKVSPAIAAAYPYHMTVDSIDMRFGSEIWCQFTANATVEQIDSLNSVYDLQIVDSLDLWQREYILSLSNDDTLTALEVANSFRLSNLVVDAVPNYLVQIEACGTKAFDYFVEECYHVSSALGRYDSLNSAWDITMGDTSVVVAVYDTPILPHEDLPSSRMVPGFDFIRYTDSIVIGSDFHVSHGMCVAGIIAAGVSTDSTTIDSTTGTIGIAPNVSIMPIVIFRDTLLNEQVYLSRIRQSLHFAQNNGARIANHSWVITECNTQLIPGALWYLFDTLYEKGMISVCATGNAQPVCAATLFPAAHPKTLGVGALNLSSDSVWYFSGASPPNVSGTTGGVDVVAPSSDILVGGEYNGDMWSLDYMGIQGYNFTGANLEDCFGPGSENNINYFCHFGGTSGACPIVSGICALLLSKKSTLTNAEVYEIIRESADTIFSWGSIPPLHQAYPSFGYGYGKTNALRALLAISRGDANNSGSVNIGDVTKLLCNIFNDSCSTQPEGALIKPDKLMGDANCTGTVEIGDVTYLVAYIFSSGPAPVSPCFKYDQYGSVLKTTTTGVATFEKSDTTATQSTINFHSEDSVHAVALTLSSPQGISNVESLVDGVNLYWSQIGDTVKIGLLDITASRFLKSTDTSIIRITGSYEIVSADVTHIYSGGSTDQVQARIIGGRSVDIPDNRPERFSFDMVYPNPGNPGTNLSFSLPKESFVQIEIFNLLGQRVATACNRKYGAGNHVVHWDGKDSGGSTVASGAYFAKMISGEFSDSKKIVILK